MSAKSHVSYVIQDQLYSSQNVNYDYRLIFPVEELGHEDHREVNKRRREIVRRPNSGLHLGKFNISAV